MDANAPPVKREYASVREDGKRVGAVLIAVTIFLVDSFSALDIAVAVLYILVILISIDLFSRKEQMWIACFCMTLTVVAFFVSHGLEGSEESCARGLISIAAIAIASVLAFKSSASKEKMQERVALLDRSQAFLSGAQRLSLTGSIGFRMPSTQMYCSEEAKRIFELEDGIVPTLELIIAQTCPDDRERLRGAVDEVCRSQVHLEVEFRLVMGDGRRKRLRMFAQRYENDGFECEFIGALMDVTATRDAEDALHRSQAELAHVTRVTTLGELAASIAHEVNQPLAAMLTDAQAGIRWLNHEPSDFKEVSHVIQRVVLQAQRASDVIRKVRALSRKAKAPHEMLELTELLAESLSLVRRELQSNHVTLTLKLEDGFFHIYGDRVQLQQVIINMVMNAVQSICATRKRERGMQIHVRRSTAKQLELAVVDNGSGISDQHLENIFSPFFTTKPTGMGMGLSICRSIIDAHGGTIWAANELTGGAVVGFRLPNYEFIKYSAEVNGFLSN